MDRERAEVMGEKGRSSDEIRRDMESTRAGLHETVEALERKLSPGQLVDELWGRVKAGDGGVGEVVREHPVPLALMGLGVAWLAVERMTGSPGGRLRDRHGDVGPGTHEPAEGRVGPYRGDAVAEPDGGTSATSKAKAALSSATDTVAGSLRSAADDAGGFARDRARQAKRGFRHALDDHPLAMGAVAFGLGLAGGLSAPGTRFEDRLMGDAATTVKDEAKEAATDVAEGARHVAEDAARAVKDEVGG